MGNKEWIQERQGQNNYLMTIVNAPATHKTHLLLSNDLI